MRKYRNYTDDDIIKYAKQVFSIAELLKNLGLRPAGGNYHNIKKHLIRLNIDTSHWTGKGWSKNKQIKKWENYRRNTFLKNHVIQLRGDSCQMCNRKMWLGKKIKLELHHIDGDRTNNSLDNLKLLCPNCHSFTPNFRNRKTCVHLS